ncbi:MAG: glutamine synthetase family protein [Myxococcota bacterium]|jgi:glutamine synthetase
MSRGRLDLQALERAVADGSIETVLTLVPDLYGRLVGKRILGNFFLEEIAKGGMHVCNYLLACDMEMDPTPGYAFTSWETGYGDMHAQPDLSTLRTAAWLDRSALVICDCRDVATHEPISVAPRNVLRRQVERARDNGWVAQMASELEFFLFRESYRDAREKGYRDLEPFGAYNEDYHILSGSFAEPVIGAIRRGADASGIPVEFSKGEASAGQHEINLRYAEALEMADRHVLYKNAAKEIAAQQGAALTFMAKWHPMHGGNSMHVHMSLCDLDGRSIFAGEELLPGAPVTASKRFRFAVGGLLEHSRDLTLLFAPTVNSYKRYREGSFAPTRVAWSFDNRTVGYRVVGQGDSVRIECRIPGGDANPYLVYAGLMAAAMDGLEREIDPGPLFEGDAYAADSLPRVAGTLPEAIAHFDKSAFVRGHFGDDVVDHIVHFARAEQAAFEGAVTDWEKARYFERG